MIEDYSKHPDKIRQDLELDELSFLSEEGKEKAKKSNNSKDYKAEKNCHSFLVKKKNEMKNSPARKKFDKLQKEIDKNILNTSEQNPASSQGGATSWSMVDVPTNGGLGYRPTPTQRQVTSDVSSLPKSNEPFIYSKVLVAAALFGAKIPDGEFKAQDEVYAKAMYEMWKMTWKRRDGNGENALETFVQNTFMYGWGAYRTYPKRISQQAGGAPRILFDDIYRVSLRPERTWLGVAHHNGDYWSQTEFMYEEDIPYDKFVELYPDAKKKRYKALLDFTTSKNDSNDEKGNDTDFVTITNYENVLTNRYIKACGGYIIYDGEVLNDEGHATVTTANCFVKNQNDPYGVGLYELGRSSENVANHMRHINLEQMEAEVRPILFGANMGTGEMTYRRGPNIVNPKQHGTAIDVVRTTGNVAMGMNTVKSELNLLDTITGINDVVAGTGSESTLGATVIAQEAAQQRLMLPRNSVIRAIERDAHVAVSFIEQTYPTPYVFVPEDDDQRAQFVKNNKRKFFIETIEYEGEEVILASQKMTFTFDFSIDEIDEETIDETGIPIQEAKKPRIISRSQMFEILDVMEQKFNLSRVLDIQIDPNSLLQPSAELTKQTALALFPLISATSEMIYQMAQTDPEMAVVKFKQVQRLLDINKENVYDWFPRDFVNKAIAGEMLNENLVAVAAANQQAAAAQQMQELGMGQPQLGEGGPPQQGQGQMAQNPMTGAMNASVGRAAPSAGSGQDMVSPPGPQVGMM